jgi:hypothetical protein
VGDIFTANRSYLTFGSTDRIDPLATLAARQPLALRVPPDFGSLTTAITCCLVVGLSAEKN